VILGTDTCWRSLIHVRVAPHKTMRNHPTVLLDKAMSSTVLGAALWS
jgi:hypothetical protein